MLDEPIRRKRVRPPTTSLLPKPTPRPRGRPKLQPTSPEETQLIYYYIIDKTKPDQLITKGSADSVAVYLLGRVIRNYIVVKGGQKETVVSLVGLPYNDMVATLERS